VGQGPFLNVVNLDILTKDLIARSKNYLPSKIRQRIYLSWQKNPKSGHTVQVGGGARAWVCDENGRPTDQQAKTVQFDDIRMEKQSDGFFVWDDGGHPMELLLFPPSVPLLDANPVPSGVWEEDGKICAFWQAPKDERKITFRLGDPTASLKDNVQYWQQRISPRERRGPLAHPIVTGLVIIGLTIAISVALVLYFGQAPAAAWVGAGGTVVALASSFILPQLHSRPPKPFKSKALSNP
jgi:hypothetical protein